MDSPLFVMNPSLRQLKAFLQVARLRSFTRAAEQLHISQAGLSSMMRELERQIGCRLFDRTTRKVMLTQAGAQLLPVAERAALELDAVAAAIGRMDYLARRTVSIAAAPLLASALLPEVCAKFSRMQPEVKVRIKDVDGRRLISMVETGESDLAFGIFLRPAAGLERRPIVRLGLIWIAPMGERVKATPDAGVRSMPWARIPDMPLIGLPADSPYQQLVDSYLSPHGRANEDRQVFNTFHALIAMVTAGFGAAILPSYAIPALRGLPLQIALLTSPKAQLDLYQVTKKGRARGPAEEDLTSCLATVVKRRCSLRADA